ncbi:MAG TPA: hypothetical protein VM030_03500 [Acidimicrobiales bacterium]|nr:hypothetical protein [Acidimicrobiales bacterium]
MSGSLEELGLARGDKVRFRRRNGGHWHNGVLSRREPDGSLGLHDERGAFRALPVELVEVRAVTTRGATSWEPVTERAARTEQLRLL